MWLSSSLHPMVYVISYFIIGCKKPVSASEKEMEWAQMACHRCLVYLGDLGKDSVVFQGNL